MLLFNGAGDSGSTVIGLGLSEDNIEHLQNGEPIHQTLDVIGLEHLQVLVVYGSTEESLVADIRMGMGNRPKEIIGKNDSDQVREQIQQKRQNRKKSLKPLPTPNLANPLGVVSVSCQPPLSYRPAQYDHGMPFDIIDAENNFMAGTTDEGAAKMLVNFTNKMWTIAQAQGNK